MTRQTPTRISAALFRVLALPLLLALAVPALTLAGGADRKAPSPGARTLPAPSDFPKPSPSLTRRIEALFERLRRSQTAQERDEAVNELVDAGSEAIPLLLTQLERHDTTWGVLVYALGASRDPRIIPILERELSHQRGRPYMEVLYALALAGEPSALLRALRSTNANIVFERSTTAVDFIAGAQGAAAVPFLIREIPRRSQASRQAGLGALGTICDASAVDFLLAWSRQKDPIDRRNALIALARIGDPRARPRMLEALTDEALAVRNAAIEGLGYLRAREAVGPLIKILRSEVKGKPRLTATWSLGLIGGDEAAAALLAEWKKAGREDQALLVKTLGRLHHPSFVPLLSRLAQGPGVLSLDAARALSRVEGATATDALLDVCSATINLDAGLEVSRELARRRDARAVPCVVRWIKEEIDRRHRLSSIGKEVLLTLPRFAPEGGAASLESLARDIAAPALAHQLRAAAHSLRLANELGPEIDPWLDLLTTGTPHEVELAIDHLGCLGDPQAIEPLKRLFGQIEPARAHLIPRALGRIGSERATPFLISLLTEDLYRVPTLERARNEAARALARCHGKAHVAKALREAFLAERGRLFVPLMALARIRGPGGVDELVELNAWLFRERGMKHVLRHERVNWAIRLLRSGREIPLEEVRDVD